MHGYTLMTKDNSNGSQEPPTPVEKPRKRPTTDGVMKVGGGSGGSGGGRKIDEGTPIPVVLTLGTILKLMVPIFGLVSLGIAFYWQTKTHIDNEAIHLGSNERSKIETKAEAKEARKQITRTIKAHVDLKMRQNRIEQREQLHEIGEELKKEQKTALKKILNEVKETRKTVDRAIR